MSQRTNDEKLKILQERLAQIKEKQESYTNLKKEKDLEINTDEIINYPVKKKSVYPSLIFKTIFISVIAYGIFYAYKNILSLEKVKKIFK